MSIYALGEHTPEIADDAYIAPGAHVLGQVRLMAKSSVWFNAVLRGDEDWLTVGPETNVQDGAVLHADPGGPLVLGTGVTVGHQAMLHGCHVGDYSLIGIQSVVLDGAQIGRFCIIGAGAVVAANAQIPDYSMVVGVPGKIKRTLDSSIEPMLRTSAQHYVENARRFLAELKKLD
ncbi:MAG: gamma carbonic anhydrase family protein [Gammaproteobacteria bacterium AqS3]|nr:gamma carbonic anhydrase family protein [Gammaproteobacteria bacterium AqS3]